MSELAKKLQGEHPIVYNGTLKDLKAAVDREYVHVKFTETQGGTELGFQLDQEASDLASGDFGNGSGTIRLAGKLNLDGTDVTCVGEIDLATLAGKGHLVLDAEKPN